MKTPSELSPQEVHYFQVDPDVPNGLVRLPRSVMDCRAMLPDFQQHLALQRREAFAGIDPRHIVTDSPEVEAIDRFYDELGLPTDPCVIIKSTFGQRNPEEALRIPGSKLSRTHSAFYNWALRIGVASARKAGNKATLINNVAHEKAHSTGLKVVAFGSQPDAEHPFSYRGTRIGFAQFLGNRVIGSFFEEGFATLCSSEYIARAGLGASKNIGAGGIKLSPRYRTSAWRIPTTALAATGLELLAAKDPEIFPALFDARVSVAGLHSFIERIRNLTPPGTPDLYRVLRRTASTQAGFVSGLKHTVNVLHDGDMKATVAAPELAGTREFFAARIAHAKTGPKASFASKI